MLKRPLIIFLLSISLFVLLTGATVQASEQSIYLEAIGGFSGSYIYTSYAYIGATADAYAKDIYTAGQVKTMMDEKSKIIFHLIDMLNKVRNTNIVENDKIFIDSMIEILELLKVEADALSAFASSNNPADVEKYDVARKKAWPKIKQLLGIN